MGRGVYHRFNLGASGGSTQGGGVDSFDATTVYAAGESVSYMGGIFVTDSGAAASTNNPMDALGTGTDQWRWVSGRVLVDTVPAAHAQGPDFVFDKTEAISFVKCDVNGTLIYTQHSPNENFSPPIPFVFTAIGDADGGAYDPQIVGADINVEVTVDGAVQANPVFPFNIVAGTDTRFVYTLPNGDPENITQFQFQNDNVGSFEGDMSRISPTTMVGAFQGTPLTQIPNIDTSRADSFVTAYAGLTAPQDWPDNDYSSATNVSSEFNAANAFSGVYPLTDMGPNQLNMVNRFINVNGLTGVSAGQVFNANNARSLHFGCSSLADYPAGVFDTATSTDYNNAFRNCALTQQSVDNILASIVASGISSTSNISLQGGTSSTPSAAGLADVATLQGRGWNVIHN